MGWPSRFAGLLFALAMAGCASLALREPPAVTLAGIEPIAGEGLESRFELRLRIQNPNDAPIAFDGLAVELELGGARLATGVSDQRGAVPRFGEAVVAVPVSVSLTALIRQAIGMATGERAQPEYTLRGRLSGPAFGATRFESRGDLMLPAALRRHIEGDRR